ncbi:uncharacterized protein LOC119361935 [Triticum dicoccoides]|uniref:uncharacterized protein LOC119361935 n=1 Tax=Triticum dicoccoides TaxID=85692 RepID=UPI00188FB1DA|nr:uncharacterized protein LOC119361935 [Triticum dicoccoides]
MRQSGVLSPTVTGMPSISNLAAAPQGGRPPAIHVATVDWRVLQCHMERRLLCGGMDPYQAPSSTSREIMCDWLPCAIRILNTQSPPAWRSRRRGIISLPVWKMGVPRSRSWEVIIWLYIFCICGHKITIDALPKICTAVDFKLFSVSAT